MLGEIITNFHIQKYIMTHNQHVGSLKATCYLFSKTTTPFVSKKLHAPLFILS